MAKAKAKKKAKSKKKVTKADKQKMANARKKTVEKFIQKALSLIENNDAYADLTNEQISFAIWWGQIESDRGTHRAFADSIGVTETTLYNWKHNTTIRELRTELIKFMIHEWLPEVLMNLKDAATTSIKVANPVPAASLFLKYVENFRESMDIDLDHHEYRFGFGKSPFIQPEDEKQDVKTNVSVERGKTIGKIIAGKKRKDKKKSAANIKVK